MDGRLVLCFALFFIKVQADETNLEIVASSSSTDSSVTELSKSDIESTSQIVDHTAIEIFKVQVNESQMINDPKIEESDVNVTEFIMSKDSSEEKGSEILEVTDPSQLSGNSGVEDSKLLESKTQDPESVSEGLHQNAESTESTLPQTPMILGIEETNHSKISNMNMSNSSESKSESSMPQTSETLESLTSDGSMPSELSMSQESESTVSSVSQGSESTESAISQKSKTATPLSQDVTTLQSMIIQDPEISESPMPSNSETESSLEADSDLPESSLEQSSEKSELPMSSSSEMPKSLLEHDSETSNSQNSEATEGSKTSEMTEGSKTSETTEDSKTSESLMPQSSEIPESTSSSTTVTEITEIPSSSKPDFEESKKSGSESNATLPQTPEEEKPQKRSSSSSEKEEKTTENNLDSFENKTDCPKDCSLDNENPVCGSDGNAYESECYLNMKNCGSNVKIVNWENCRGKHPLCPDECLNIQDPVCGDDGKIYPNLCLMYKFNCGKKMKTYHLVRCFTSFRGFRHIDNACPKVCPELYHPVCGSNNKIYSNECFLRIENCGKNDVQIVDMSECVTTPKCPHSCTPLPDPVCGSDGLLYLNHCYFANLNCGKKTEKMPRSFCEQQQQIK